METSQSDGQKLLESYASTLQTSTAYFRALLASSSSKSWKKVTLPPPSNPNATPSTATPSTSTALPPPSSVSASGLARKDGSSLPLVDPSSVIVHKRSAKGGEVYRAVVEVPIGSDGGGWSVENFRALLGTAEVRCAWDSMVESATTVEHLDCETRIVKTAYKLGWPSSPRDTITISKTFSDAETIINISTSLPRSADEPAYLRPAPPYVRAMVSLLAFCIQMPSSSSDPSNPPPNKLQITCFWQWNPKGTWAVGSSIGTHLPDLLAGLVEQAREYGSRVPLMTACGKTISLSSSAFDLGRDTLNVEYAVVPDEELSRPSGQPTSTFPSSSAGMGSDSQREEPTASRSLEFAVPANQGWRIQVSVKSSLAAETDPTSRWEALIGRPSSPTHATEPPPALLLRISHPALMDPSQISRLKLSIARDPSSKTIRVNGIPQTVRDLPASASELTTNGGPGGLDKRLSRQLVGDETASLSGISLRTVETIDSAVSGGGSGETLVEKARRDRSEKAERSVSSYIRRSYIYFTSLLQEPEAKWKPVLEAGKGVSVHQLDSLDPTLVVYRAEAVFVGVGIWDLLAAINSPGAKAAWDKTFDDAVLLEDVTELSELWWWKSKAAWPVSARDSVVLKTIYKSPTCVHIFSFSTEDRGLFPTIPPSESGIIRTQVDLQGWSIEALSPTTTQVTLLEQSDPKGWSNKTSIPQTMANALTGVGEFTIKFGGPPVVTRLSQAKVLNSKFDLDKSIFRVEYQPAAWRKSNIITGLSTLPSELSGDLGEETTLHAKSRSNEPEIGPVPNVECEIRCDFDTWTNSLELVIDPPPQSVSCLRRHRLSAKGGGGWITIEHDAVVLGEENVLVIVRKGPSSGSKDKNVVTVNGSKIKVDVEDLPDTEVKLLSKQKRTKPNRIPLDRPPVLGVIRRRHPTVGSSDRPTTLTTTTTTTPSHSSTSLINAQTFTAYNPIFSALGSSIPQMTTPFNRFWFTPNANASLVTPPPPSNGSSIPSPPSTHPMQASLEALDLVRQLYFQRLDPDLWTPAAEKDGLLVSKRNVPSISTAHAVHRASRVFQGSTAEDVFNVVSNTTARSQWDDRFESPVSLESYGNGCSASFFTSKCAFPFRDRGFFVSTVAARGENKEAPSTPTGLGPSSSSIATLFLTSASFPESAASKFATEKLNPYGLPVGRLLVEGWVMETLDPYGNEQYTIPSTRCTYYSSIDYTGSIPSVLNSSINASLPRVLLALQSYLKSRPCPPLVRLPPAGLRMVDPHLDVASSSSSSSKNQGWTIANEDIREIVLLKHTLDPIEQDYRLTVFVQPQTEDDRKCRQVSRRLPLPELWTPLSIPKSPSMSIVQLENALGSKEASFLEPQSDKTVGRIPTLSSSYSSASLASSKTIVGSPSKPSSELKDFCLAEFVVDTGQFPAGYNVTSSAVWGSDPTAKPPPSSSLSASVASPSSSSFPLSLYPISGQKKATLPFKTTIKALIPSILHSASLTPARSSRKHLVRITLPTTRHLQPPLQDPLRDASKTKPTKPSWLESLESRGAVVVIAVDRLAGQAYDEPDQILVTVEGSMTQVQGRDNTQRPGSPTGSSDAQPAELGFDLWPRLERLDEDQDSASTKVSLPLSLTNPIAIAKNLLPGMTAASESAIEDPSVATLDSTEEEEPSTDVGEAAHPHDSPATPTLPLRKFSNASTPLFNFFGLSRLGGDTTPTREHPTPTTTLLTIAEEHPTSSSSTAHPIFRLPSSFSFTTLVVVAVISFLLGSLIRSLLTPSDFVIYLDERERDPTAQRLIEESWREIKRLVEWKGAWWGEDLVLAVVRRP